MLSPVRVVAVKSSVQLKMPQQLVQSVYETLVNLRNKMSAICKLLAMTSEPGSKLEELSRVSRKLARNASKCVKNRRGQPEEAEEQALQQTNGTAMRRS